MANNQNKPYSQPNIMDIQPETLARQQEEFLANGAAAILEEVAALIRAGQYKEVQKYYTYSPAGDYAGGENHYIDFTSLHSSLEDIEMVATRLQELRRMQDEEEQRLQAEEEAMLREESTAQRKNQPAGAVLPPAAPGVHHGGR